MQPRKESQLRMIVLFALWPQSRTKQYLKNRAATNPTVALMLQLAIQQV
jgi:hypothetical protein